MEHLVSQTIYFFHDICRNNLHFSEGKQKVWNNFSEIYYHEHYEQVGQVFPKSDFSLLVIFFSIFSLSMISFCFLVR